MGNHVLDYSIDRLPLSFLRSPSTPAASLSLLLSASQQKLLQPMNRSADIEERLRKQRFEKYLIDSAETRTYAIVVSVSMLTLTRQFRTARVIAMGDNDDDWCDGDNSMLSTRSDDSVIDDALLAPIRRVRLYRRRKRRAVRLRTDDNDDELHRQEENRLASAKIPRSL
jgi:hypothetical protein